MVGFSAGSNLILNLVSDSHEGDATSSDPIARESSRPNFVALCATWAGGQNISKFKIDATAPPAYLFHAKDDRTAKLGFAEKVAEAWQQAGVPVELEVYETGGHMAFRACSV